MTLPEFLLARIGEEEAQAGDYWRADYSDGPESGTWWHWVLAECDAKRRIVAECVEGLRWDVACGEGHAGNLEIILSALALPYADHPDYRDEWKP